MVEGTVRSTTSAFTFDADDGVAVLRLDDGKANAVDYETLAAIDSAVADTEQDAKALVLAGREGRFSTGFDLGLVGHGPEAARAVVAAGPAPRSGPTARARLAERRQF